MSPPPIPRRASTAIEDALESADKRVAWFKGIIAAGLAAATVGWVVHSWSSSHATKDDLERARTGGAAELAPVAAEVRALVTRQAVLEAGLASLKDDLADLKKSAAEQRAWLLEIAKAVGARTVNAPTTSHP